MTTEELEAQNGMLNAEIHALRGLIEAIRVAADPPKPADNADLEVHYFECTRRADLIAVYADWEAGADLDHESYLSVMETGARVLREHAARPLRYTPRADDEYRLTAKGEAAAAAGGNPPSHVTVTGSGPCDAEDGGYVCNAQAGHDGPLHIAYGPGSVVCHTWPVAAVPAQDEIPSTVAS